MRKRHELFQRQLDAAQEKLHELEARARKTPRTRYDFMQEVLTELSSTMEELHVSAEELRQMNDQVVEAGKEVEAERERYRELFDFAPDAYLVTSTAGIIQQVNRTALTLMNRTREFVVGKPFAALVAGDQVRDFREVLNRLSAGVEEMRDLEYRINLPNRRMRDLAITVTAAAGDGGQPKLLRWLVRDNTQRKRAENEIKQAHAALDRNRETLRALASQLLMAQEEERRRLSRNLHDDLNQKLALLAVEVESLEKGLPKSRVRIRQRLRTLRDQIVDLSDNVHSLAYALHPSVLDDLGLAIALNSFLEDFGRREKIKVQFTQRKLEKPIPPEVASCLYRIVQEGLRNVAKHARTRQCRVSLTGSNAAITLSVEDNGAGFDLDSPQEKRMGLGIVSMQERVRLVNGTFSIKSAPRRGTQIMVRVPLEGKQYEATENSIGRRPYHGNRRIKKTPGAGVRAGRNRRKRTRSPGGGGEAPA